MGSTTNLKENKTLFIPCGCRSEILVIEYNHETGLANFAIYEHPISYKYKLSVWQRLSYCYRILFNKKLYADQITLNKEQLKELKQFMHILDI